MKNTKSSILGGVVLIWSVELVTDITVTVKYSEATFPGPRFIQLHEGKAGRVWNLNHYAWVEMI